MRGINPARLAAPVSVNPAKIKPIANAPMPVASSTLVDEDGVTIGAETAVSSIAIAVTRSGGDQTEPAPSEAPAPPIVSASLAFHRTPDGRFAVQLGSYRNIGLAAAELTRKQSDLADVIGGDTLKILSVKLSGGSGVRYRLKVSGFASRDKAAEVCAMVRNASRRAWLTAPPGVSAGRTT